MAKTNAEYECQCFACDTEWKTLLSRSEAKFQRHDVECPICGDPAKVTVCLNCGAPAFSQVSCDARGIGIGHTCQYCDKKTKSGYRTEIFTNSQYEIDETIEAENY